MSIIPCQREDELLDAMGRGFVGAELAAHVEECSSCSELQLVAGALLEDGAAARSEATVPGAGTMWWRMQIRQRQEAQSIARRSLLIGQAVTLAVAMVLVVALLGTDVAAGVREAIASVRLSKPLLLALTSTILLAPLAGWVAIRQK